MVTFSDRKSQTDSVYDFHDDSDADEDDNILTIDESPKKRRWNKNSTTTASSEGLPAAAKSKWGQSNHTQIHLSEFTCITCCCLLLILCSWVVAYRTCFQITALQMLNVCKSVNRALE